MSAKHAKQPVKKTATTPKKPVPAAQPVSENVIVKRMFWFLVFAAFMLYANTLGHGFVLDDIAIIEKNAFVKQGFGGIDDILGTFYWEGYWASNAGLYRPLSLIMFAIEWAISPENPFIHHFVNVLLYAISIGVLFRLLSKMFAGHTPWIAFFIALLFAVHPIHTEVVANIKSRDEILCFLFSLLTFRYLLKHDSLSLKQGIIAAGLFLLCLLSKEAGILFLPIIGLYYLLLKKETILPVVKRLLPLAIVAGLWLCLHQYIIATSPSERITYTYLDNSLVACEGSQQVATGVGIFGRYLLKTVLPVGMSYDYSYNQIPCETFGSPLVLAVLAIFVLLIWVAFRFRKTHPVITFGLAYFFITMLLVTNVFTLIGATMGDRLLYAPVLGICMVLVYVPYVFLKNYHRPAVYAALAVALVAAVFTINRNADWFSNTTLFAADVENTPNSARVQFNHGVVLMEALPENIDRQQSQLPEVIGCFERALKIDPKDAGSHTNVAVCYYRMKNYRKSADHSKAAVQINPNDISSYNNLADALFKLQQYDSAIVNYRKVLAAGKATEATYNFMGVAFFNQQKYDEAAQTFEKGLKQFPTNTELMMNLANTYGTTKNYPKALEVLHGVIRVNPNHKQAYYFLAMTYQNLGDLPNTDKYFQLYQSK